MTLPAVASADRRIGYVLKVFPRVSETFIFNEIRALESFGEVVDLLPLHHPEVAARHRVLSELRARVTYIEDEEPPAEDEIPPARKRIMRALDAPAELRDRLTPRKYVRLALNLARHVRERGLTHLHAHFASRAGHVAMLAAALSGASYSITAHAKDIYHEEVDPELLRLKLTRARFIVTVTDYNARYLRQLVSDVPGAAEKIVRLYNGIDLERFRPADGPRAGTPLVLAVGRLVEKKGFGVLIDACALLAARGVDFRCEIVGTGELDDELRRQIDGAGLAQRVRLVGALTAEEVAEKLQSARLMALPCVVGSDGNVDALPTVLLEAMAAAVPVVSTPISGIPEIVVDGETGVLIPSGDAARLADALARLLGDAALSERFGRAGRERAHRLFDLYTNAAVLRRLLHDGDGARG